MINNTYKILTDVAFTAQGESVDIFYPLCTVILTNATYNMRTSGNFLELCKCTVLKVTNLGNTNAALNCKYTGVDIVAASLANGVYPSMSVLAPGWNDEIAISADLDSITVLGNVAITFCGSSKPVLSPIP